MGNNENTAEKILRPSGEITLPALIKPFDPDKFFRTRKGLLVRDGFREILSVAREVKSLPDRKIASFDIIPLEIVSNEQIRAELPEGHTFDPSEFCARFAGMIERQADGNKGDLSTDENHPTITYVFGKRGKVVIAHIRYLRYGFWEWRVDSLPLSYSGWFAGVSVLSATTN
ncbi:TPA: hypothetical protein DCR79_01210 [Patescibacteria group bacterium]|nr:hypothetical protein [Patescibacteria group bacterium]